MNRISQVLTASLLLLAVAGCENDKKESKSKGLNVTSGPPKTEPAKPEFSAALAAAFKPALPAEFENKDDPITEERVSLGRMLYFDKRLSKNHDISCNTCHQLDKYGVDGTPTSSGHKKQLGTRNSPTVYNAAGHFVQFWDGRSPHVEDQATGPVLNAVEMAYADEATVAKTLKSIPEYVTAFKAAFPDDADPVSLKNAGRAMGSFERRLVTPSPWDKFLNGDESALTDAQKEGFMAFTSSGCPSCHMGTLVGGTMYQKLGVLKPWPSQKDQGRFEETKKESDKMMFKVPSLRNVTETGPYFHDGSEPSLKEAVKTMGTYQLGREISDADAESIVAWLGALKGELPTEYIKEPELPKSTPSTPKPDPT